MAIVIGGAFANAQTQTEQVSTFETPMRKYRIDYLMHGFHAEPDLANLLRARRGEVDISTAGNLCHFDAEGRFQATEQRWNDPLLDDQPACFDQIHWPFVNRTVQTRTSCGCTFNCAFCSYPRVARGFQTMSLDAVDRSLASIKRIPGVRNVVFVDDTFNIPPERFRGICDLMAKHRLDWYSFLRVQFIDEDDAKRMRDSGCRAVYLGIESANDQVLKNMNKKATQAEFARGVGLLRKNDIVSVAAFVLGFPGETEQTIDDDARFVEETGLEFYTLKPFYYMEHTGAHEKRELYQLSGMGGQWSHKTMDSVTVQRHLMRLFREIKGSCYLDADSSLWHVALMRDAGFSFADIERLQRETNGIVLRQLDGHFDDADPGFARLKAILDQRNAAHV
jgi:p-methyltransferase